MKALQFTGPGRFEIVDTPIPEIADDEVLVEVKACNTCTQWDITVWKGIDIFERAGHPQYPLAPGATGHELAGVVARAGKGVTRIKEGDHVAFWGTPPGTGRPRANGGYAQYYAGHERSFVPYPTDFPFEQAGLTEIFCCLSAALFKAGEVVGKRVAVSGMGPAGLIAIQALKARGAEEVTAFDIAHDRLELAHALGADRVMVPGSEEWRELLPREKQFDVSIDCIGVADSVNALMQVTRRHLIIFGVPHGNIRFSMDAWLKDLTVEPCGPRPEKGAYYARHLLTTGQVKVDRFIGARLPLEEYAKGVQLLIGKRVVKVCFDPWA
ncbi:MAG TPA: zinc-binding dehydrogenase [Chloroflexota bacterium]|nr:zinc-binding dehydrogenase [Chloroflexota bacterium]